MQHWKKKPVLSKGKEKASKRRWVIFDNDGQEVNKKERSKAIKKDHVFINFIDAPE